MDPDSVYTINISGVGWQIVDEKAVLLDITSGCYYSLNETGTQIWKLIASEAPVGQIVRHISEEFGISPRQAQEDVFELVASLEAESLILKKS